VNSLVVVGDSCKVVERIAGLSWGIVVRWLSE